MKASTRLWAEIATDVVNVSQRSILKGEATQRKEDSPDRAANKFVCMMVAVDYSSKENNNGKKSQEGNSYA